MLRLYRINAKDTASGDAAISSKHALAYLGGSNVVEKLVAIIVMCALIYAGNPAIALVMGMLISLTLNHPPLPYGNLFGKYALQTAIVLLGFKLNTGELMNISGAYALPVTAYVCCTVLVGLCLGYLCRSEGKTNALISSGTAICGGTTIATLSPIIGARPEQTGTALCIVFLLNALALLTFPSVGRWLDLSQEQFGVWAALAIHDTSSVVATAQLYGEQALAVATTVKIGRTLWLIPLIVVASLYIGTQQTKIRIPNFVFIFIAASALGSWLQLSETIVVGIGHLTDALLIGALFFVGTEITRETLKELRLSAVLHGLALWALVIPAVLVAVIAWVP
jgi:uncharacterized integral membrane protein (TIGR00698 family)